MKFHNSLYDKKNVQEKWESGSENFFVFVIFPPQLYCLHECWKIVYSIFHLTFIYQLNRFYEKYCQWLIKEGFGSECAFEFRQVWKYLAYKEIQELDNRARRGGCVGCAMAYPMFASSLGRYQVLARKKCIYLLMGTPNV